MQPVRSSSQERHMSDLRNMSVRELICALSQVEDEIRNARPPTLAPGAGDTATSEQPHDLATLVAHEQQISHELRRRRNVGRTRPAEGPIRHTWRCELCMKTQTIKGRGPCTARPRHRWLAPGFDKPRAAVSFNLKHRSLVARAIQLHVQQRHHRQKVVSSITSVPAPDDEYALRITGHTNTAKIKTGKSTTKPINRLRSMSRSPDAVPKDETRQPIHQEDQQRDPSQAEHGRTALPDSNAPLLSAIIPPLGTAAIAA